MGEPFVAVSDDGRGGGGKDPNKKTEAQFIVPYWRDKG
jgi:hypothetical protein